MTMAVGVPNNTAVGIPNNILINFFTTLNLYKPTNLTEAEYELLIPKYGTQFIDAYSGRPAVTSQNAPVVLKYGRGYMRLCSLNELFNNFVFSDGTPIGNIQNLLGKFSNFNATGREDLKPKKGSVKVLYGLSARRQVVRAIFVPAKYMFTLGDVMVNDPRIKGHADGDYLIYRGNHIDVVGGAAFEYAYDMSQFRKSTKQAFARQLETTFNNSRYDY